MTPNAVLAMAFRGEGCSNGWLPDLLPALREYFSLGLCAHSQETDAEAYAARVRCEQVQGTWDERQHGRATHVSQDAKVAAAGTASTLLPIQPIAASVAEF